MGTGPFLSGGLTQIEDDPAPRLGGDLDVNGHNIAGVTETVLGYFVGVTSDVQAQINAKAAASHSHDRLVSGSNAPVYLLPNGSGAIQAITTGNARGASAVDLQAFTGDTTVDRVASGICAAIGGGTGNKASGNYAAIPGGRLNVAGALYSHAEGYCAKAVIAGQHVESSGGLANWTEGSPASPVGACQRWNVSAVAETNSTQLVYLGGSTFLPVPVNHVWLVEARILATNGSMGVGAWLLQFIVKHSGSSASVVGSIRASITASPYVGIYPSNTDIPVDANLAGAGLTGYVRVSTDTTFLTIQVKNTAGVVTRWHADIHVTELLSESGGGY